MVKTIQKKRVTVRALSRNSIPITVQKKQKGDAQASPFLFEYTYIFNVVV